jgi:phosphoribosylformylglycinamidine (FGAM) synthase PurS component
MVFDVHVEIGGLDAIADPEGRTIERAMPALGFRGIADVRVASRASVRGGARAQAYLPR